MDKRYMFEYIRHSNELSSCDQTTELKMEGRAEKRVNMNDVLPVLGGGEVCLTG